MLNKRTQILFDREMYQTLVAISQEKEVSIGELVRRAIKRVYANGAHQPSRQRSKKYKAINRMLRISQKISLGNISVKDLIRQGQRYNEDLDY